MLDPGIVLCHTLWLFADTQAVPLYGHAVIPGVVLVVVVVVRSTTIFLIVLIASIV